MTEIIIAKNAGFCFGVKRAMDAVNGIIGKYGKIYTYGELIHNNDVIKKLEEQGVEVTRDVGSLPEDGDTLIIIRSHGVPKDIYDIIKRKGFDTLDLTCPFVKRIHDKVKSAGGRPVIIVGAADHPEVIGIRGWAQGDAFVVDSAGQAEKLRSFDNALVVAQTTITSELWNSVVPVLEAKVGDIELFGRRKPRR